jgi:hypothetical protein
VALKVRRSGVVNVHTALSQKQNPCPISDRGQTGCRLRSAQVRILPGYVGSNFRRHRLQSVTTLMPVSGSPEVVCHCVADIATRHGFILNLTR